MATWYVDHTKTGGTNAGTSWANAWLSISSALSGAAAGDTVLISSGHQEGSAAQLTSVNGTNTSPVVFISANNSTSAYAKASAWQFIGTGDTYMRGADVWIGVFFDSVDDLVFGGAAQHLKFIDCTLNTATGSGRILNFDTASTKTVFTGCTINCLGSSVANSIIVGNTVNRVNVEFHNTTLNISNAPSSALFSLTRDSASVHMDGCAINITTGTAPRVVDFSSGYHVQRVRLFNTTYNNITAINNAIVSPTSLLEVHNFSSGNTRVIQRVASDHGYVREETTIKRTGGASDGVTAYSLQIATWTGVAKWYHSLRIKVADIWVDTSTAKTFTCEVVHDSQGSGAGAALQDNEAWIEVLYPNGTTSRSLSVNDRAATVQTTPADQTSSAETWTTTGLTTPVKQKLSVTTGTGKAGVCQVYVCLAKPSSTIYVCPKIEVT